jgi:hypothetical protein
VTNLKDFTETTVKFGGSLLKRLMNAKSSDNDYPFQAEESKTFTALELERPATSQVRGGADEEVTPLSILRKAKDGLSIGVSTVSQSNVA